MYSASVQPAVGYIVIQISKIKYVLQIQSLALGMWKFGDFFELWQRRESKNFFFNFMILIFFHYSWFIVFCQFLLYSKVTQSCTHTHTHTYIYIFFFSHYPTSCSIPSDCSSLCCTAGSHQK